MNILEMFKTGQVVVNCRTQKEAEKFIDWCYSNGVEWLYEDDENTEFSVYKESTCYRIDDDNYLVYGSEMYYETADYEIITFNEFMGGMNMFTKDNLKTGMLVKAKNGEFYKVILDYATMHYGIGAIIGKNGFMDLSGYNNDLTYGSGGNYDIVEVYSPVGDRCALSLDVSEHNLIWKREDVKEMTMEQLNKLLGYSVKIIE